MNVLDPLAWGWRVGADLIYRLFWGWGPVFKCPGPLGGGGTCRLQAITGGTARIQPIRGGKARIHES